MTETTDIAALREAAFKATRGEWRAFTDISTGTCAVHTPEDKTCGDIVDWPGFDSAAGSKKQKVANAKYIALANPKTILALLNKLEAAEARVKELETPKGEQEPVAVLYATGDVLTREECADDKVFAVCCKVETPLFTRQPKPVVVRKIGHIDHDGGEYGEYFVELTDSAEIGRAVYVIEEGEAAGIVVKDGEHG